MKILIYGSRGWIGKQVIDYLKLQMFDFFQGIERVDDVVSVEKEIDRHKPTHILSLIGRTHGKIGDKVISTIDYLEEDGKLFENIRDNLYSPLMLAMLCNRKNIHFTYLGTGCIFDYDNDHPLGFTEQDIPNFFGSSYSIVKGFTDSIMKQFSEEVLNLRIRMPINSEKSTRNFITKITTYDKICSIPYAVKMMVMNITGTINLTNPGVISHNEILELYREIVDPLLVWKNFTIDEQNLVLSSKRSNNMLNTDKLSEFFPEIKNIKESVIECLKKYPKPKYDFPNEEDTCILVTGGCGFIGSHFVNHIFEKYDKIRIVNIDAMYYCANEDNVLKCVRESSRYTFLKMNINDIEDEVLNKFKINYVCHFAAQSHVQNSFEDAIQYTKDNVLGTHRLLEYCRKNCKLKKYIHVSTDEVYGESKLIDNDKKTELTLLSPTNPYAGTKAGAELITQTYLHSFNLPIVITRGNNVYGPNQYPEKLIPKFINLLKRGKKVTVQGEGKALRSFLHVSDTVSAFECILQKGKVGEIYNIGCDEGMEYSVMEVAKILIEKMKGCSVEEWIEYVEDRPFNDIRYYISNSKLKDLGWVIRKEFEEGIEELIL